MISGSRDIGFCFCTPEKAMDPGILMWYVLFDILWNHGGELNKDCTNTMPMKNDHMIKGRVQKKRKK